MVCRLCSVATKIAGVLRDDLAVWQKANVTAFLVSGIAGTAPDTVGDPYADGSGNGYLPCSGSRCSCMSPTRRTTTRVRARQAAGRRARDYTHELFTPDHDEANRAAVAAVPAEELDLTATACALLGGDMSGLAGTPLLDPRRASYARTSGLYLIRCGSSASAPLRLLDPGRVLLPAALEPRHLRVAVEREDVRRDRGRGTSGRARSRRRSRRSRAAPPRARAACRRRGRSSARRAAARCRPSAAASPGARGSARRRRGRRRASAGRRP